MSWLEDTIKLWWNLLMLQSGNEVRRNAAACELGKLRNRRAVPALINALKDKDGQVRATSVLALLHIEDERAIEPLKKALKDNFWSVRYYAAGALGEKRERSAVEPLIGLLKDSDNTVRLAAAMALNRLNDERAIGPLLEALEKEKNQIYPGGRNDTYRVIALAIFEIARGSVPKLLEVLKAKNMSLTRDAIERIAGMGEPVVGMLFEEGKKPENRWIAGEISQAIGKINENMKKKPQDFGIVEGLIERSEGRKGMERAAFPPRGVVVQPLRETGMTQRRILVGR